MSGIGRAVAAILLAGAVAGAAAFAHRLGNEPATVLFGPGALPPAPTSPLIVEAATPVPERSALSVALARPTGPAAKAPVFARPVSVAHIQAPPAAPSVPASLRARIASDLPAAATPTPTAPTPVATPTPAPVDRALAQTAPAVTTPVSSDEGKHKGGHDRRHDQSGHGKDGGDQNGNNTADDNGPTVLGSVPIDAVTPAPIETPAPPSIDPPSVDITPVDSGGHQKHDSGHGDRHGDEGTDG